MSLTTDTQHARRRRELPPGLSQRLLAVSAVAVAAVIWSSSFAVTKVALDDVPPMTLGALRFAVAAVILRIILLLRRERSVMTKRQKISVGSAGLLGITAYFALENVGVDLASASDATLIVASYPVIALLLELPFGKTHFSLVRLSGMTLAIAGVCMVVASGPVVSSRREHRLVGDLLLIAGGFAWATYNIVAQRNSRGCSAVVTTYYQTMAGTVGFIPLSFFEAPRWSTPSAGSFLRIAFLAVFCSVAAFLAYNFGLRSLSASVAVNLLNIVPVAGLMWAVVLAGETLVPSRVSGGAVVILGVTLGLARTHHERVVADTEQGSIGGER